MKEVKRSDFLIKPFLKRNNFRALYQIITTIIPIISIWFIIYQIINNPFSLFIKGFLLVPIICLLTLFSSRTFSLMHDCGHSLFYKTEIKPLFGFYLFGKWYPIRNHGLLIMHSIIEIMEIGKFIKGPIDVLSLEDYNSLSKERNYFTK